MTQGVTSPNVTNDTWAGDDIKRARKKRGLTQRALGDLMGVSVTAVSKWESGQTTPTYYHRKRMSELFSGNADLSNPADQLGQHETEINRLRSDVDRLEGLLRSLVATLTAKFGAELADLPPAGDE